MADNQRRLDTLHGQLRSQSADIDELEAETAEQRSIIEALRGEIVRLRGNQQTDARDLVQLAGKLLAFSHATGVELDDATKKLFRRRGWITIPIQTKAQAG